jgi:hypothetical protein
MRRVIASPGFVPHEAWDKFVWLLPHETGKEPWYYAAPRETAKHELPSEPEFMKTVDPALRPLVGWLHSRGIPTGPSCAGHDITKRGFDEIYKGLERDADKIRTDGLLLRNPEDGSDYVMIEPDYALPWSTLDEFRQAANDHQPIGWLPFYTTDPRIQLVLGNRHGLEIKETGPDAYGIKTTGENPDAWHLATDLLHRALS